MSNDKTLVLALEALITGLSNLPLIINALNQANYISAQDKEQLMAKLRERLDEAQRMLITWEEALEKAREDIYGPSAS